MDRFLGVRSLGVGSWKLSQGKSRETKGFGMKESGEESGGELEKLGSRSRELGVKNSINQRSKPWGQGGTLT